MSKLKDFYEVLSVTPDSSDADLKTAYRELARKFHPDKNLNNEAAASEKFKEVINAYSTLSDPYRRMVYDLYGPDESSSITLDKEEKETAEWKDLENYLSSKNAPRKRSRSRKARKRPNF